MFPDSLDQIIGNADIQNRNHLVGCNINKIIMHFIHTRVILKKKTV
jgi:hypothetical protein